LNSDEINYNFLETKNDTEHTLLHYSTLMGITKVLVRLWNWVKKQQTSKELNNNDKQTACPLAAAKSKLEALGKLWKCVNEELSAQGPNNRFLVYKDDKERTAWNMAAKIGNVIILK